MRDTVFLFCLRYRELVVAGEVQVVAGAVEDRVRAPRHLVGRTATRCHTATPLVGEENLRSFVVERRRVPVREIRIHDGGDSLWIRRVLDVEQDTVT